MNAATLHRMKELAAATIAAPTGMHEVAHEDGDTADIVAAVLEGHRRSRGQLDAFARALAREGLLKPLNIWYFVRHGIEYELDPAGEQWIKTPRSASGTGVSDCKSKSIFIATLLGACGVACTYRFASYNHSDPTVTHVYVLAHFRGRTIPIDAVWPVYGQEKAYTHKEDHPMKISHIGAVQAPRKPTHGGKLSKPAPGNPYKALPEGFDPLKATEGELSVALHLQRLRIKQAHAAAVRGVGSPSHENLQDQIDLAEDILDNMGDGRALEVIADQAAEGAYSVARQLAGIGATARQARRQDKKAGRDAERDRRLAQNKTTGESKKKTPILRKVVSAVKKAAGAAVKVATFVPRTIIKGIIEVSLPKAAPNFLYLFINDAKLIERLPDAARRKRKKAEEMFLFITKGVGMKADHVKAIIRNGILERFGKEPEQLIAAQLGGSIAGIGLIDDAFEILVKIVKELAKVVKGAKAPKFEKGDAPDPATDFPASGGQSARTLAADIERQPGAVPAAIDAGPGEAPEVPDAEATAPTGQRTPRKGIC